MATTYTLIYSNVLSSSQASITFSSIPATYTDLVLRISARDDLAQVSESLKIILNGDTATNYSATFITGNGSTATSGRDSGAGSAAQRMQGRFSVSNSATSNTFGNMEIYFAGYTSTGTKVSSIFGVAETNATAANMAATASQYRGGSAISSMEITSIGGGNFLSTSSFYLYGISNA